MQQVVKALAARPGVDCAGALERLSDNKAMYAQMLWLFFNDTSIEKLTDVLVSGDIQSAILEAHSMKGTAANLGLDALSKLAAHICQCLRDQRLKEARSGLVELELEYSELSHIVMMEGGHEE